MPLSDPVAAPADGVRTPDMRPSDYPGLFCDANEASGRAQRLYMNSLKLEYLLLIIASIFGLNLSSERLYHLAYAVIFLLLICVVAYRTMLRPEQAWYKSRALAESIKTSTWRFMMRAPPFQGEGRVEAARQAFRSYLKEILQINQQIGEQLTGTSADRYQVSPKMDAVRAASLAERRKIYREERIGDQRQWYVGRARQNRRAFRLWIGLLIFVYCLGTMAALARVAFPDAVWLALDPLTVVAASLVGWVQVKKFTELAASYALTAYEIGLVESRAEEVVTEADFADFVNEAELAFSREHTQWIARQHGAQ